jgi:hypothetical protein
MKFPSRVDFERIHQSFDGHIEQCAGNSKSAYSLPPELFNGLQKPL